MASPVSSTATGTQSAAAAPALAKESIKPVEKETAAEESPDKTKEIATPEPVRRQKVFSSKAGSVDGAAFLRAENKQGARSGGSGKVLVAAVAIPVLIVAAYFGWSKFAAPHSSATPYSVTSTLQPSTSKADVAPSSAAATSAVGKFDRPGVSPSPVPASSSASSQSLPTPHSERITLSIEPGSKQTSAAPIRVKPLDYRTAPSDETITQPPSPLAIEAGSHDNLSGLLASNANAAKPSLAQVKISQGVLQGLLIKLVQPKYPATHAQGTVEIEATVDREGKVVGPKLLSGNKVLAAAALEAVRQWRYKPYYLNGEPVEIQTEITIKFKGN